MYEFYCKQLNESPEGLFSIHHSWVEAFYRKETTLTYEEFFKIKKKKELENNLSYLNREIQNLQEEKDELILKIAEL